MSAGFLGRFPATRMRRNRRHEWSRSLVREHRLSARDLIWPVFIIEGAGAFQQEQVIDPLTGELVDIEDPKKILAEAGGAIWEALRLIFVGS